MKDFSALSDDYLFSRLDNGGSYEDILVERYLFLVRKCARPFYLVGSDSEDLIQEGMIGLLSAVRTYSNKSVPFVSYAEHCIKMRIYSAIRASMRNKHQMLNNSVPLDSISEDVGAAYVPAESVDSNPEEAVLQIEHDAEFKAYLNQTLSKLEKSVLELYLQGLSYTAIAEKLNIKAKAVDNAVQRIRKKVARFYN